MTPNVDSAISAAVNTRLDRERIYTEVAKAARKAAEACDPTQEDSVLARFPLEWRQRIHDVWIRAYQLAVMQCHSETLTSAHLLWSTWPVEDTSWSTSSTSGTLEPMSSD